MALSEQDKKDIEAIIRQDDIKLLVKKAERLGEELRELETHQIRRFFGTVRQIKREWREGESDKIKRAWRELNLLKPKLSYQKRRVPKVGRLEEILSYAIDLVEKDRTRFDNFVDFFEAIVAYHTEYAKR